MMDVAQAVAVLTIGTLALCALGGIQHIFVQRRARRLEARRRPVPWRAGFHWDWDVQPGELPWWDEWIRAK